MKRLFLLMLLTGCATTGGDQSAELAQERQALEDTCRRGFQAPTLDQIRSRVPVLQGLTKPTLEMLSDSSSATDEQRPAILALDAAAIDCSNQRVQLAAKYYGSDYAAVSNAASSDAQRNRLELYRGAITWGQYVTKSQAIVDEARGMFAALDQRRRQLAVQQQSANAQSAGAAAAMLQATQPAFQPIQPLTLQPLPQIQRPINCTSVRQGAYTTTNCR